MWFEHLTLFMRTSLLLTFCYYICVSVLRDVRFFPFVSYPTHVAYMFLLCQLPVRSILETSSWGLFLSEFVGWRSLQLLNSEHSMWRFRSMDIPGTIARGNTGVNVFLETSLVILVYKKLINFLPRDKINRILCEIAREDSHLSFVSQ
jgi:hypothetical protein